MPASSGIIDIRSEGALANSHFITKNSLLMTVKCDDWSGYNGLGQFGLPHGRPKHVG